MKVIIVALSLLAVLSFASQASADGCLCIGINGTAKACGSGGMGGSFLRLHSTSNEEYKYYLTSVTARAEYSSAGKAFDSQTGWYCWKGQLP